MQTSINISPAEFQTRAERLRKHLESAKLSGVVLFSSDYILYYTGFAFIPTERPIAFVMNVAGEKALFVPRLEVEHAQANALINRVDHYLEYPYDPHPMQVLAWISQSACSKDFSSPARALSSIGSFFAVPAFARKVFIAAPASPPSPAKRSP